MILRRYKNRKIYSKELAKCVNLNEVLYLYKDHNNLQIIDVDGENITDKTLLTALYEVELVKGISKEEIARRIGGL